MYLMIKSGQRICISGFVFSKQKYVESYYCIILQDYSQSSCKIVLDIIIIIIIISVLSQVEHRKEKKMRTSSFITYKLIFRYQIIS